MVNRRTNKYISECCALQAYLLNVHDTRVRAITICYFAFFFSVSIEVGTTTHYRTPYIHTFHAYKVVLKIVQTKGQNEKIRNSFCPLAWQRGKMQSHSPWIVACSFCFFHFISNILPQATYWSDTFCYTRHASVDDTTQAIEPSDYFTHLILFLWIDTSTEMMRIAYVQCTCRVYTAYTCLAWAIHSIRLYFCFHVPSKFND